MSAFDPYADCPCGSGEKYKWCCQKVEAIAERAARMTENGQPDAALKVLDEGLRSHPNNPWLGIRKAYVLARRNEIDPAMEILRGVIARNPKHVGALELLVKLALMSEGPRNASGYLQQALTALPAERRRALSAVTEEIGSVLAEIDAVPAAVAHLRLSDRLDPEDADAATEPIRQIEGSAEVSPWLRNPYQLSPVPEGLDNARRVRFQQALDWADQGLWASAAAAFDTLSAESTPESDRNLGLCRLWLADHAGAVEALRRYTSWVGASTDNVDLEALCQLIEPIREGDRVDLVQWIWPLRNRERLITILTEEPRAVAAGRQPLDPGDPTSPEVDVYHLLDRPAAEAGAAVEAGTLPVIQGRLVVGQEIVVLEAFDDGRLDRLSEWLKARAGDSIPPAHPRSKLVGSASRHLLSMRAEWLLPPGTSESQAEALTRGETRKMIEEVWATLPHPALNGRTPEQAAKEPGLQVPLRASLLLLERDLPGDSNPADYSKLRESLGVSEEPPIDPATDVNAVHIGRLHQLDPAALDDEALATYFARASRFGLTRPIARAARVLIERPALLDVPGGVSRVLAYSALTNEALNARRSSEALEWIERGRKSDTVARRGANAVHWDLLELRTRAVSEPPESWVPMMAAMLERHRDGEESQRAVLLTLVRLGLVRGVPNPDRPGEILLDTRPLQTVLAKYGPRITTATGELGISATKPQVWTPGSEPGAPSGGLWTPGQPMPGPAAPTGSPSSPPGDKPRLIIPGR